MDAQSGHQNIFVLMKLLKLLQNSPQRCSLFRRDLGSSVLRRLPKTVVTLLSPKNDLLWDWRSIHDSGRKQKELYAPLFNLGFLNKMNFSVKIFCVEEMTLRMNAWIKACSEQKREYISLHVSHLSILSIWFLFIFGFSNPPSPVKHGRYRLLGWRG